ncbi:hypothetical protein CDAR_589861 [Caerostris darwini]|uniref:Uncharacterized protein n=1 Tax=Caerostris darwini TaxID=1538125 RepID=A0AAV4PG32_9ARAC|nr:hypothetical protein CDAR_589861 [Caerostris darwini]
MGENRREISISRQPGDSISLISLFHSFGNHLKHMECVPNVTRELCLEVRRLQKTSILSCQLKGMNLLLPQTRGSPQKSVVRHLGERLYAWSPCSVDSIVQISPSGPFSMVS